MTEEALRQIHERMKAETAEAGGEIEAIYYCPHDWDEGCECRKPKPGLLFQAQRELNLDLSRSLSSAMMSATRKLLTRQDARQSGLREHLRYST